LGRHGELLSQDTFFVGTFTGVGKVYLHTVVATYGSYDFGFLYTSEAPEAAVAVLHNDVLPCSRERAIVVEKILTDHDGAFCGTATHRYELYLALNDNAHKRTKVLAPQTNGFVSASTAPPRRSASRSPCASPATSRSTPWRRTPTAGSCTTTRSALTKATATWVAARSTPTTRA
jgi:hypothetical protein